MKWISVLLNHIFRNSYSVELFTGDIMDMRWYTLNKKYLTPEFRYGERIFWDYNSQDDILFTHGLWYLEYASKSRNSNVYSAGFEVIHDDYESNTIKHLGYVRIVWDKVTGNIEVTLHT